ncbi:MAG: hydroxyacylglutathione hydrolase [Myxococcales bacterium]|nr:hydroxyacylglutathione hydrolase [Myxococcales bacterium]
MRIVPVPCLSDNFAYLVICEATKAAAVVDPGEAPPIAAAVAAEGVTLVAIWATHHHPDHVGGVAALVAAQPDLAVIGHASDRPRIGGLTRGVVAGDELELGELRARVIENPGHTSGAISFVVGDAVFTGDTLFGAGCGRMFEGTPPQMQASLARLAALPPTTRVYFGHEYTAANLRFAAAVEPDNPAIAARAAAIVAGVATTPSTIADERATNPFVRVTEPTVVAAACARDASIDPADPAAVFGILRRWKDTFR